MATKPPVPILISPGVYNVGGRQIKSATPDAALRTYNNQIAKGIPATPIGSSTTPSAPQAPAAPPPPPTTAPDPSIAGNPGPSTGVIPSQAYTPATSTAQGNTVGDKGNISDTTIKDKSFISDPTKSANDTIQGQIAANQQADATQFNYNNPNQQDIAGNQRQTGIDASGQAYIKDVASQPEQNLLQGQQGLGQTALSHANDILSNLPQGSLGPNALQDRQQVQGSLYANATQNLETQYKQQKEQQQQDLANRGIPLGSDAYNKTMNNFENQYQNYRQQAYNQAVTGSAGEQQSEFGMQQQTLQQALQQLGQFQGMGQNAYQIGAPQFTGYNPITQGQGAVNVGNTLSSYGQYATLDPAEAKAAVENANASLITAKTGQQSLGIANNIINQANTQAKGSPTATTGG